MKRIISLLVFIFICSGVFAQWSHTSCNDLDRITALGTKGDTVFAATYERFYISSDQGETWNDLWNGLPYFAYCFDFPSDGPRIYAGSKKGVYISYNNGDTFVLQNNGYTGFTVKSIVKYGTSILVGNMDIGLNTEVLFQSQNQGQSWQCISTSMDPDIEDVYCLAAKGSMILAGTRLGVFISNNQGITWTPKNTGLDLREVLALAVRGDQIFCGTPDGLFESDNDGETWTLCTNGLTGNECITSLEVVNGHVFAGCFYGAGVKLLRSFETSWTDISTGLNSMQILNLSANDQYIFAGTDALPGFYTGGVFRQELAALVGIEEDGSSANSIQVIPNPMNNTITIQLPDDLQTGVFTLCNAAGQTILKSDIQNNITLLDVSRLRKGIYFWELKNETLFSKGKVVIR